MKVSITTEDIENGRRGYPQGCPVGLAIMRNGVAYCCVAGPAVVIREKAGGLRVLLLPEPVQEWIRDFDEQRPVGPIGFELGLPVAAACGYSRYGGAKHCDCPRIGRRA